MNTPMAHDVIKSFIKRMIPKSLLVNNLNREAVGHVLLTFDDGPDPFTTPRVLDMLRVYDVRSIFFIPGSRIARAPEMLEKICEEGHSIGNHSYVHSNTEQPGLLGYYNDIQRCQREIEKHAGMRPRLFRPPGGRISVSSLFVPRLLNLRTITWSLDVMDWQCRTLGQALQCAESLMDRVSSRDIILLHDDNPWVIDILDVVLPALKDRGLNFSNSIEYLVVDVG